MGNQGKSERPATARRYTPEDKARAVRLVRQLRKELGTTHGTVQRVADQIGCGVESLRTCVKQADIDEGVEPGVSTVEAKRIRDLHLRPRVKAAQEGISGPDLTAPTGPREGRSRSSVLPKNGSVLP